MWPAFLIIVFMHISFLVSKPIEKSEDTIWQSDAKDSALQLEDIIRKLVISKIGDSETKDWSIELEPELEPQSKRGFSMFSRIRPFNSAAKQKTSIRHPGRSVGLFDPMDIVSAETRAHLRPVGQPLRWG